MSLPVLKIFCIFVSNFLKTMNPDSLYAITPIDGRYLKTTEKLSAYFSEFALLKNRVMVEVEYFIALTEIDIPPLKYFDGSLNEKLREIYKNFSLADAKWIKTKEKETNHDIKAVEYFVKSKFEELGLHESLEFIHFGLTSQDINNTAIPFAWKNAVEEEYLPTIQVVLGELKNLIEAWKAVPLLARTHGQPASPTTLGKELKVFAERIERQLDLLKQIPFSAKFGGATGNFNAHYVSFKDIDWCSFADVFVHEKLGLQRSKVTTQIEHYDNFAASCDALKRINTILIDLARDIWTYISMDYFKQEIIEGQIGSSAMPHKVNPIDFENAEGNLGMANAFFEHLSAKLPVSRLQRDLSDSTVLRNIGVPFSHTFIALNSIIRGLKKLKLNPEKIQQDLDDNWMVVAEALQTILRREGYPKPYEILKDHTRTHEKITQETIRRFIEDLNIKEEVKAELSTITPSNYTGVIE